MRAIALDTYGGPEVLHEADVADPGEPGPGQVRIRTTAAAVNPVDLGTRAGRTAGAIPDPHFPMVLGWDTAGVVESAGPGVERFAPGDRIVGLSVWFSSQVGTYAEVVVLDDGACAPAPTGISDEAAVTIPLNGLTAWSALAVSKVGPDDALLVTGAAGAVGGYAVQLAKQRGIRVIGLGRGSDAEIIASLGADEVIEDYAEAPDVAFAIDTTGAPDLALAVMGTGGRLVTVSGRASTTREGVEVKSAWVRADAAALEQLCAMAASGVLTTRLADVLPLADAAAAHRRFGAGGVRGRIVLRTGA